MPDLQHIGFWESKCKDLDDKIERVTAKVVQPRFTPVELQTLESLEQQDGHFYHTDLVRKRKKREGHKREVFNTLFDLARRGLPGQWVLHNEELYHSAIDTRPETRTTSILIRDSDYTGDTRVQGDGITYKGDKQMQGDGILVEYELRWAGKGPHHPDFTDFDYWKNKASDLFEKLCAVEGGTGQHHFTPKELKRLESMECNPDHAFAKYARERKENSPVGQTPESGVALQKLGYAVQMVVSELDDLWDCGLAGQWVLHHEDLYVPKYDTRCRGQDNEDSPQSEVVDNFNDLRYDGARPPPDFGNIAYWQEKRAYLQKRKDDAKAGKVQHLFTEGELRRIELLELAILQQRERRTLSNVSGTDQKTDVIAAWLDTEAMPRNRKRTADESLSRHATRPAKRSKQQTTPNSMPTMPTQSHLSTQTPASPPQNRWAHSRATLARPPKTRAKDFVGGRSGIPERQARRVAGTGPDAGQYPRRRGGSSTDSRPPRRSSRIAALGPINYR